MALENGFEYLFLIIICELEKLNNIIRIKNNEFLVVSEENNKLNQ